jgi:hypothetical protein
MVDITHSLQCDANTTSLRCERPGPKVAGRQQATYGIVLASGAGRNFRTMLTGRCVERTTEMPDIAEQLQRLLSQQCPGAHIEITGCAPVTGGYNHTTTRFTARIDGDGPRVVHPRRLDRGIVRCRIGRRMRRQAV